MLKLFLVYCLPPSLIIGSGTRVGLTVVESTTELILISFLSVRIENVLILQFNPNPSAYAVNFIHSTLRFSHSRFFPLLHFNETLIIGFLHKWIYSSMSIKKKKYAQLMTTKKKNQTNLTLILHHPLCISFFLLSLS